MEVTVDWQQPKKRGRPSAAPPRRRCRECDGTGLVPGVTQLGKGMGSNFGLCPGCDGQGFIESTEQA